VFAYVADGEKCRQWRPGVIDIKRISGNGSVGTRYALDNARRTLE
jgi:hypothetical protein